MAQKNRAQMLTDITTNIFNNVINFITGQNAQDRLVNLLDSSPNIISDKDQADGYVGLDANGNMFSSYYNENISRADLVTLLTTNTAIGYKLYQVNDAVGATKILLVIADSNITLYPFAIDLTTAEIGTYNINTDTFTVLAGSGNASIIPIIEATLAGLETANNLNLNALYVVTDAQPFVVMCKAESVSALSRTATIIDTVFSGSVSYDVQSGAMSVIVLSDGGANPNQWFGTDDTFWSFGSNCGTNRFYARSFGVLGDFCTDNTFEQQTSNNTLGNDCVSNTFEQNSGSNTLGNSCINNTFKQNSNAFIFGDNLQNVTIEANTQGADYTASPTYDFLYNNTYPSTIFFDGTDNYHRYYDIANDRIVLTNLTTLAVSYIGGGGGGITKATAAGTDTYTTTIVGVTGYVDGDTYLIRFTNGNTTGATLDINTLGAKSLYRNNDGALIGGDIWNGGEMLCIFNSTLNGFQCIGTSPNSLFAYVTNAETSTTITKGQAVYVFGGQGDRITVKLASNQSDTTSAQTIGIVVTSSIAANQRGIIIVQGQLDGLSLFPTSTWADGDFVYLGATAGTVTKTKPYAPDHLVYLGYVVKASAGSAGRMYVKVQNGYELDELHNVSAQTPADKDGLFYNSTTGLWTARQVAATDINANVSNTEFGYLDGVTSNIQTQLNTASTLSIECIAGTIASPVDATTYYWCIGGTFLTASTSVTGQGSKFAYNFELIGITIRMTTTTAGSAEDSTLYLRNITTSTSTLMGTFKTNGNLAYTSITGLAISCNTTDEYCLEMRSPTWATNPANLRLTASLFLRRT